MSKQIIFMQVSSDVCWIAQFCFDLLRLVIVCSSINTNCHTHAAPWTPLTEVRVGACCRSIRIGAVACTPWKLWSLKKPQDQIFPSTWRCEVRCVSWYLCCFRWMTLYCRCCLSPPNCHVLPFSCCSMKLVMLLALHSMESLSLPMINSVSFYTRVCTNPSPGWWYSFDL